MCSTRLPEREQHEAPTNWPATKTTNKNPEDSDEEGSVELECRENMDENEEAFDSSDDEDMERKVFPQQRVSPSGYARRSLTPDVCKMNYSPIPFTRRARTPEVSSSSGALTAQTKSRQQRQTHKVVEPTFRTPRVDDKVANMATFTRPLPAPTAKSSSPGLTISGTFAPKGSVFRPKRHLSIGTVSQHPKQVHTSFGQQHRVVSENIQQHTPDNTSHQDGSHPQSSISLPIHNSPTKSPLKVIAPLPYIRPSFKPGVSKSYAASSVLQGMAQHLPSPKESCPIVLPKATTSDVVMSSFTQAASVHPPMFRPLVSPPLVSPAAVTTTTFHFSAPVTSLEAPAVTVSPKFIPHSVSPARTNEVSVIHPKVQNEQTPQTEGDIMTDEGGETILKRYINDGMEA